MITTAITAGIVWVLNVFGVPPDAGTIAGVWIAVKITIMSIVGLMGWRAYKKRKQQKP